MKRKLLKFIFVIVVIPVFAISVVAFKIYSFRNTTTDRNADAAVVLGAAIWGNELSPVFKERVNHSLTLYREGRVKKIIFTGGKGSNKESTESSVAKRYAIENGVPEKDILIEEKSRTTYENFVCSREVIESQHLKSLLVVSDPIHMKRSMMMAQDLGLEAYPSPTPTTRYRSFRSQVQFLAHEIYYYFGYLIKRE